VIEAGPRNWWLKEEEGLKRRLLMLILEVIMTTFKIDELVNRYSFVSDVTDLS